MPSSFDLVLLTLSVGGLLAIFAFLFLLTAPDAGAGNNRQALGGQPGLEQEGEEDPLPADADADGLDDLDLGDEHSTRGLSKAAKRQLAKAKKKQEKKMRRKAREEVTARRQERQRQYLEEEEERRRERNSERALRNAEAAARREAEEEAELAQWQGAFEVHGEGLAADDAAAAAAATSDSEELLLAFERRVAREHGVIVIEEMARDLGVRPRIAVECLRALEAQGRIHGVFGERGRWICFRDDEMRTLARFIRTRGRVSLRELAQEAGTILKQSGKGGKGGGGKGR